MIPHESIAAWRTAAPWSGIRQVEQDLIISRALVDIFSDDTLRGELRFRGGTALHKLHFPAPLRYSEDIDLTRTSAGPVGSIIDQLRNVLEPWLGPASYKRTVFSSKLNFRAPAEGGGEIKLKVEINTREHEMFDPPQFLPFAVDNPWFSGGVDIPTFSREEMLATKLRALLQRDKGRDLYDLAHALDVFDGLNTDRLVEIFGFYLDVSGKAISRAQAEERMFTKLNNPQFFIDIKPLLSADRAEQWTEAATGAFQRLFTNLISRLPGEPWAKTPEMKENLGFLW